MRQAIYTSFAILALVLVGISSCKKADTPKPATTEPTATEPAAEPDYFSKMAGEWRCSGENNAAHVAFSSPTTWTAMDTSLILTNQVMKIKKLGDVTLQVTCMGYDQYMGYTDLGTTFEKCETKSDKHKVEYVESNYDPMNGYGRGRRLTYYIREDSIFYYADYKSTPDKFDVRLSGRRN
jgi:hypothetical protein